MATTNYSSHVTKEVAERITIHDSETRCWHEIAGTQLLQFSQLNRATPIIIPIAAMEQHGHHLPLFTDSLLLGEVVRRVHEELEMEVVVTPCNG